MWKDSFFTQHIIPSIYARKANKAINEFHRDIDNATIGDIANPEILIDQLKKDLLHQNERKKALEDKVKAILFSVSISITAITFSLTYGKPVTSNLVDLIAVLFLLFSILYFVVCAILSVYTLMPVKYQLVQTLSKYNKEENSIVLFREEPIDEYKWLMIAKIKNDNTNLQLANLTYASLKLLRNAIILFSLYFIVALIAKNLPQKTIEKEIINSKKIIKVNDTINISLLYTYEKQVDNNSTLLKIGNPEIEIKKSNKTSQKPIKKGP